MLECWVSWAGGGQDGEWLIGCFLDFPNISVYLRKRKSWNTMDTTNLIRLLPGRGSGAVGGGILKMKWYFYNVRKVKGLPFSIYDITRGLIGGQFTSGLHSVIASALRMWNVLQDEVIWIVILEDCIRRLVLLHKQVCEEAWLTGRYATKYL